MSELKTLFEAYGGDYAATMRRFMGNESLYYRLLPKLFEDGSLQRLGEALDSGDLAGAFEAAHTLKGVTANLGLTPLFNVVCLIVEPLRVRDVHFDYPVAYQAIQAEYARVEDLWRRLNESRQE